MCVIANLAGPWKRLLAAFCGCALSACSNVSRFDVPQTSNGPSVVSIVNRVRCEIGALARPAYPHGVGLYDGDFVVVVQLNLTVNDDGSLAPAFTYTNGIFSLNAGARLEASREQNYTQNLIFSIRQVRQEINAFAKAGLADPYSCDQQPDTELAGDLGIKTAVDMAFATPNNNFEAKASGTSGAFGGYVNFTITKNVNAVGPTWTLKHFKGPGSLAGLSEVNTDKIVFAFAQSAASGTYPNASAANAYAALDRITESELATQLNEIRINTH